MRARGVCVCVRGWVVFVSGDPWEGASVKAVLQRAWFKKARKRRVVLRMMVAEGS